MNAKRISLSLAALLVFVGSALGDGVMLDGVSPRSISRGGTNIAFADNGAILFDNPAGAVNIDGNGLLDIGANLMIGDFRYSDTFRSATETSVTPLPQIALIRKSADGDWAYGLGLYVPAGFSETYDMQGPPALPVPTRYKSFGALMKILPGVAYRVNDRLSIGATAGVGVSHVELEGPYFLQGPNGYQGLPTLLDLQSTGATFVWSFGLQYALTDATTIGATYQSESRLQLHGPTRIDSPYLQVSPLAFDSQVNMTWPQSVGIGVKHDLCACRTVSADVLWTNWSAAFDDIGIRLRHQTIPQFPTLIEELPLRWRDTVSVRLGYERHFDEERTLRLGYVYHQNPIPAGTLTPYIQGIMEHGFSIGYGWMWRGWNIDTAYMFSCGPTQHVGTSDLVGNDFGQSTQIAQTHCFGLNFIRKF
jgi:long-chain fatty acid transport protein